VIKPDWEYKAQLIDFCRGAYCAGDVTETGMAAEAGSGGRDAEAPADAEVRRADIRILGSLEVESAGQLISVGGSRQRRLLATLLVNVNAIVPLDRLVDALWEVPPSSARQQIHNVVGALRRALAPVADVDIVTDTAGYKIVLPELWIDSVRFQADVRRAEEAAAEDHVDDAVGLLEGALANWRGPALAGLTGRQLVNIASRLDEQRLAAIELLMSLRLRRGEASALVGDLMELVAEHPLRESLRSSLMVALWRSGRQADGLAVFEDGRRLLAEELGLDPSPALRALHEQILSDGGATQPIAAIRPPEDQAEAALPSSADRRPTAVCYLPHDLTEFTGRTDEVEKMLADASHATATALVISAIDGMGGVGKTTVAVHLAHRIADRYPDGQYFIDLHSFTAGMEPLSPLQALDTLLRDSGTPAELIPADLTGRSALWRSRMARKRALILLDNALDAGQVRPLLPGTAGTLVLITSRRKLTALEGSTPVSLDVLSHSDAVELFANIAGPDRVAAEPEATAAAVELCGRLPLAVRIASARLRDRRSWTVAYLVRQLRSSSRRARLLAVGDRSVLTVLAVSYKYLSTDQRRLFRLLSLHPGADLDAHAAAALTDLPLDQVETALEALFEDNLLLQHSPGRYQFHDLIRDCSRELSEQHDDGAVRQAATQRLLDYYLYSAQLWCQPLAKGPYRQQPNVTHVPAHVKRPAHDNEAVALLKVEYHNLVAATRFAAESGSDSHTWQLACSLQPYFRLLNYGAEATRLFTSALQAARAVGDAGGESACLMGLALAARARGRNAEARGLMTQAIDLSRAAGDQSAEAYQLADLGITHLNEYQFEEAYASFLQARRLAIQTGDRQAMADLANNLGVVCRDLGRLDDALRYFRHTLRLDKRTNSRSSQAVTLNNIGLLLQLRGRYREARIQFEEALELSLAVSSRYGESFALVGLCLADRSLGDFPLACEHGRRALGLTRSAGLYDVEWDALNCLGDALVSRGDLADAERTFRQAEELAQEHGSSRHIARAREGLAHVWFARGNLTQARRHWESALATFPVGVLDADNARRHLRELGNPEATCRRCDVRADQATAMRS
jgi:DNA-binding SARP family transcriptional activator/tetratricopeptide (TPR) repeat protein